MLGNPWTLLSSLLLSFFFILIRSPYAAFAVNQQGEALLSWKARDVTPCNWLGIVCNFNNQVVELELRYVDLFGQLPANFTSLLTLNKLVLSGANLTGPIPKEISTLTQLTHLDLSENVLSGEIPSELCCLYRLQQLHLNSNQLKGSIPIEIGNLTSLKWLILYDNQLSGGIPSTIGKLKNLEMIRAGGNKKLEGPLPPAIGNYTNLVMLGVAETSILSFFPLTLGLLKKLQTIAIYTAYLSGQIPPDIGDRTGLQNIYFSLGNLRNLKNLLLWQNNLVGIIPLELGNCNKLSLSVNQISGEIPSTLGNCRQMTHIELDNNQITGAIPGELGNLTNLTILFLWQNKLEGNIPDSISNCYNLEAVDLSQNSLTGPIPTGIFQLKKLNKLLLLSNNLIGNISPDIGNCSSLIRLQNLNFLDLGSNRLTGFIPQEISGCRNLTFLDLHSNSIGGTLPLSLSKLISLQFVDFSDNLIEGTLSSSLGSLSSLTKLVLGKNRFFGSILTELGSNQLMGNIPTTLGKIPALEIALNLSWNQLTGEIPEEFTSLDKLAIQDISHNQLWASAGHALLLEAPTQRACREPLNLLLRQPVFCIQREMRSLNAGNIIGRDRSGVVYRVTIFSGLTIVVKMFRSSKKTSASSFSSEIVTLARIRHHNILRLLGWGANRKTKLLFYDYMPNETLGALLHEGCGRDMLDWDIRFKIALGLAEGLAYLHHDCVPAIIHRDVKAHNILLGDYYKPYLADFGLARLLEDENGSSFFANPEFAGSFGYMAPEYDCILKITEKGDVYSYGVVLLEMITGKKSADPSFPDGHHKDPVEILDPRLQALGISLLYTSNRADDQPIMKDVAALLKEIRQEPTSGSDAHKPTSNSSKNTETATSYTSLSVEVIPAELLQHPQGSSRSQASLAYSSSSVNYFPRCQ
ncbi:hypothetical protein ES319_D02G136800v1 [Gossypium barbadense]|uniref:non-specific serine/threonine protein kinase n=1 Tax=Gossypium barbadense TaxID=3634 RepID=A0A5J5SC91_GOSBA|nr:hypothetical protein ES319_D02G136800v1 [Gossypium barbadense]